MVIKNNTEGREMMQTGLLDWQIRFKQLDNGGDPLRYDTTTRLDRPGNTVRSMK